MPARDDEGRFVSDRDYDEDRGEGRRYSSRGRSQSRYDRDDDYRGRRSQNDQGQGGWFGDSEGHSQASRRGWDNPDHGQSGWYGDSEGHSQASRRGWDNPDHGPSGWFGDSEGHSQASRRGWDNPDHGPSGWFGDSEGHSEASREGWRHGHRNVSSRGTSRYEDDRGRYDRDYDDDRSYRSRRRTH
jgi:hypothetical protein